MMGIGHPAIKPAGNATVSFKALKASCLTASCCYREVVLLPDGCRAVTG